MRYVRAIECGLSVGFAKTVSDEVSGEGHVIDYQHVESTTKEQGVNSRNVPEDQNICTTNWRTLYSCISDPSFCSTIVLVNQK